MWVVGIDPGLKDFITASLQQSGGTPSRAKDFQVCSLLARNIQRSYLQLLALQLLRRKIYDLFTDRPTIYYTEETVCLRIMSSIDLYCSWSGKRNRPEAKKTAARSWRKRKLRSADNILLE